MSEGQAEYEDRAQRKRMGEQIKLLSQMLCYTLTEIEKGVTYAQLVKQNPQLLHWWNKHKAADAARLQQENADKAIRRAKKAALAKLTPEEKVLLGFNEAV
jgi:hypothetical protein